jgi:hypothetical protein
VPVVPIVIALGAATAAVLAASAFALVRHIKLVSASLKALREDLRPSLAEIGRGSERAAERAERLAERRAQIGGGARIHR